MSGEIRKKIPQRRCVGCNISKDKKQLIRVVRSPNGEVSLDFKGKKSGRGAYVCPVVSCFKKAKKSKRLEINLDISIPEELYQSLEEEVARAAELQSK